MKRLFLLVIFSVTLMSADTVVSGVAFKKEIVRNGQKLILNGVGVREKYFIDLYVAGLYLKQKETEAQKIIDAEELQYIKLTIVSSLITNDKFKSSTIEGFKQATKGNTKHYESQIHQFLDGFGGSFAYNDQFDLVYEPGNGLLMYKNGKLNTTIKCGVVFKGIVMRLWLGDFSNSDDLKEDLLGGTD